MTPNSRLEPIWEERAALLPADMPADLRNLMRLAFYDGAGCTLKTLQAAEAEDVGVVAGEIMAEVLSVVTAHSVLRKARSGKKRNPK